MSSNTERPAVSEPPVVISDDENDFEISVVVIDDDDLCCQDQNSSSNEREVEVFSASQLNSSLAVGELDGGENLCPLPGVAETEVEILDEEPTPVVEPPRKRKKKTKNTCVVPGKPVRSSRPVPPNKPSPPPPVPALGHPCLPCPFPWIRLSCQVCLSCLPTSGHLSRSQAARGDS